MLIEGIARINDEAAYMLRGVEVRPGDVLLNITGDSIARCTVVDPTVLPARVSQHVAIIRPTDDLNPVFLQKYLTHPTFKKYMLSLSSGGTRAALTKGQIENFVVPCPPRWEQDAIAAVLGALDDKIAVNERIARASDELCGILLQRLLKRDEDVRVVPLGEIAAVNKQSVKPVPGGHLRYIDISSISAGRVEWPERSSWDDAPGRARRGVSRGDTIWSTVRPGRRSYALVLDDDPELVVSTGLAVLTPRTVGPAFLYEVTKRDEFVEYLESVAEGSAYPAVRADRFAQALVPLPSLSGLKEFEDQAMALRYRAHTADVESRSLAKLRDTLLPGLMSGAIRVGEAEKAVEEAT